MPPRRSHPPVPIPIPPRPRYGGAANSQFDPTQPPFPAYVAGAKRYFTKRQYYNFVLNENWFCDPVMADIWDNDQRDLYVFRMVQTVFEAWHCSTNGLPDNEIASKMRNYHRHTVVAGDIGHVGSSLSYYFDPANGFGRESVRSTRHI